LSLRWWRRTIVGLFVAIAAGCSSPPPPAPPPPPPSGETACLQELDARRIVYDRLPDWHTPEGCGIDGAVRVRQTSLQWNRPALMGCPLALVFARFESEVVQPEAKQGFGRTVRKVSNAGAYVCRAQRGGRADRLSEHAKGRAIDITGFELDDGTVISILRDWYGKGAKSEFLHRVALGACRIFSVVITPNRNEMHRDHLHLDIGPYKLCGY
jgi:hypothetical protein